LQNDTLNDTKNCHIPTSPFKTLFVSLLV